MQDHRIFRRSGQFIGGSLAIAMVAATAFGAPADEMPWVRVGDDGRSFVLTPSGETFVPRGLNYDHDETGRLLEDYWESEWAKVEEDFGEMRQLGANVVRIHLQLARFVKDAETPNTAALDRLARLLELAQRHRLYLDLTGLGCYHKQDVPEWYDRLPEARRWDVQAMFWESIAARCAQSPAVFCYDLMNEPVVGGQGERADWLGPAFAGKHFVQFIALSQDGRQRPEVARQWIVQLRRAIRRHDRRHLITVGLVPWSLDRPGLTSGFVPEKIVDQLDFVSVHLSPEKGKVDDALDTLKGFSLGKPVVIEETFPLKCSPEELAQFVDRSRQYACGWIGFYWGKTPQQYDPPASIGDAITLQWLRWFETWAKGGRQNAVPSPGEG